MGDHSLQMIASFNHLWLNFQNDISNKQFFRLPLMLQKKGFLSSWKIFFYLIFIHFISLKSYNLCRTLNLEFFYRKSIWLINAPVLCLFVLISKASSWKPISVLLIFLHRLCSNEIVPYLESSSTHSLSAETYAGCNDTGLGNTIRTWITIY